MDEWRRAADRPTAECRSLGEFYAAAGSTPLMLAARAGSDAALRLIVQLLGTHLLVDRYDHDGSYAGYAMLSQCSICWWGGVNSPLVEDDPTTGD